MSIRQLSSRFGRRATAVTESILKLLAMLKPAKGQVGTQRMCPFCGLITPRAKRFCLECGKSLGGIQLERKDAKQG